ncbi:MAG: PEP-CTERM sorting domain-containing protein, partial [Planctomycetales bacterium]|nr:PEP-CTERM sorting domain-containing protein [Planctomycetales bacterium]
GVSALHFEPVAPSSAIQVLDGNVSLQNRLTSLPNQTLVWDVQNDALLQVESSLTNSLGNLTKTGTGMLELRGDNFAWNQRLDIEGGTVSVVGTDPLGSSPGGVERGTWIGPHGTLLTNGRTTFSNEMFQLQRGTLSVAGISTTVRSQIDLLDTSRLETTPDAMLFLRGSLAGEAGVVFSGNVALSPANGANTYQGQTVIESGLVSVTEPGALGTSNGTNDGTRVLDGATLQFDSRGIPSSEYIELQNANLDFGSSLVDTTFVTTLAFERQNVITSSSEVGIRFRGHWTGSGGVTFRDMRGTLQQTADYSGPTSIFGSSVQITEATALGDTAQGTYVENGGVSLERHVRNAEPFHIGSAGQLFVQVPNIEGPLTLATGSLLELNTNDIQFHAPVQVRGIATVEGDARSNTVFREGVYGSGTLNLYGLRSPIDVEGEIGPNVNLSLFSSQLNVNHSQTLTQSISLLDGGKLHANADIQVDDLRFEGTGQLSSNETARITLQHLDPKNSLIDANLVYDQPIRVDHAVGSRFVNLGETFGEDIFVQRGTLNVLGPTGLGNSLGTTEIVEGSSGRIRFHEQVVSNETILLNNSHGLGSQGALTGQQGSVLQGTVDLGAQGSSLGDIGWNTNLELQGPVLGGDLRILGGKVTIASAQVNYTGATDVQGELRLTGDARLSQTSKITIAGQSAKLVLDNQAGGHGDRVADDIPLELAGGVVQLIAPATGESITERLGDVSLIRGHSQWWTRNADDRFVLQSLQRETGATVDFGAIEFDRFSIENPLPIVNGTIGGWAQSGYTFVTMQGDEVVSVKSIEKSLSSATNGQHIWWRDADTLTRNTSVGSFIAIGRETIDLGNHRLTINSGGIIGDGVSLVNGELTSGVDELFLHQRVNVGANIVDHPSHPVSLVITGDTTYLSGQNTYSGSTTVNGLGHAVFETTESLPQHTDIYLNGGDLSLNAGRRELGELVIRDGGNIHANDTASFIPQQVTAMAGNIGAGLTGNATLEKTTPGILYMWNDSPGFSGPVHVNEGVVVAVRPRSTGSGQVVVKPNGILAISPNSQANTVLDGGRLWGYHGNSGDPTSVTNLEVRSDSRIESFNFGYPDLSRRIDLELLGSLTGNGNLTIDTGSAMVVLSGRGDQFRGNLIVESGRLAVGNVNAFRPDSETILMDEADLRIGVARLTQGRFQLHGANLSANRWRDERAVVESRLALFQTVTVARSDMDLYDVHFMQDSRLQVTEGGMLNLPGNVHVYPAATFQVDEFDLDYGASHSIVSGSLIAAAVDASWDLIGGENITLDLQQLVVPDETSFQLLRHGQSAIVKVGADLQQLTGGGRLENNVVLDGGSIAPGDAVGQLTIQGNVSLRQGMLQWELDSVESHDMIDVLGQVDRGNEHGLLELEIQLTNSNAWQTSFDPQSTYSWEVLRASSFADFDPTGIAILRQSLDESYPLAKHADLRLETVDNKLMLNYVGAADLGDFDQDGQLDSQDIELLVQAIRGMEFEEQFDLDMNTVLDGEDLLYWVEFVKQTTVGDSNLDGKFDSSDLVMVFQAGQYEDDQDANSTWSAGDWNGDGDFTTADLVLAFQRGDYEDLPANAVPEPTSLFGLLLLLVWRTKLKRREV